MISFEPKVARCDEMLVAVRHSGKPFRHADETTVIQDSQPMTDRNLLNNEHRGRPQSHTSMATSLLVESMLITVRAPDGVAATWNTR